MINDIELLPFRTVTEFLEVMFQGCPPASCRKDDTRLVHPDVRRVYYLVSLAAFEHPVLVYAGRMGESIAPDYGLVRLEAIICFVSMPRSKSRFL